MRATFHAESRTTLAHVSWFLRKRSLDHDDLVPADGHARSRQTAARQASKLVAGPLPYTTDYRWRLERGGSRRLATGSLPMGSPINCEVQHRQSAISVVRAVSGRVARCVSKSRGGRGSAPGCARTSPSKIRAAENLTGMPAHEASIWRVETVGGKGDRLVLELPEPPPGRSVEAAGNHHRKPFTA